MLQKRISRNLKRSKTPPLLRKVAILAGLALTTGSFGAALFPAWGGTRPANDAQANHLGKTENKSPEKEKKEPVGAKDGNEQPGKDKKDSAEASEEGKASVVLTGGASEESAGPKGIIRFWITVENRSAAEISKVELRHPEVPGFRLMRLCWPGSPENHCEDVLAEKDEGAELPRMNLSTSHLLTDKLLPSQAVTIWGYLEAEHTAPKQTSFLTLDWQRGTAASSKTVTIGDMESLSWLRAWALVFIHGWEWSFPLAAVLFGFLYRQYGSWSEGRNRKSENERDHQRRTWNMMLPRAQQIALSEYMPIVGAVMSLRDELCAYQESASEDDLSKACYYLLMFHRRLRHTLDKIGAYYFKNRRAESLADKIYNKHRILMGFLNGSERKQFSAAVDQMKLDMPFGKYAEERDRNGSAIQVFWKAFLAQTSAKNPKENLDLTSNIYALDAYAAMLDYEANRPSLYWYGEQPPIHFHFEASKEVFIKWDDWKEIKRLNLSDGEVKDYELWGKEYLLEAVKPVVINTEGLTIFHSLVGKLKGWFQTN